MGLAALAAIFVIYGKDLPDYAQLERYEPATMSRIYSGEGALMDEFARERRIFTPIDEIPDRVKQAFISAEDKNFYAHHGFDPPASSPRSTTPRCMAGGCAAPRRSPSR